VGVKVKTNGKTKMDTSTGSGEEVGGGGGKE